MVELDGEGVAACGVGEKRGGRGGGGKGLGTCVAIRIGTYIGRVVEGEGGAGVGKEQVKKTSQSTASYTVVKW